jgi:hypothetical protein
MREIGFWSPKRVISSALLLCFFIAGISFWKIPYSNANVPNSFFGIGVTSVFLTAAVLAFKFGFRKGFIGPALVFPAVLMVRVIVEGIIVPSRHNLWPLALIITVVLSLAVAGTGATLGWLVARLFRRRFL